MKLLPVQGQLLRHTRGLRVLGWASFSSATLTHGVAGALPWLGLGPGALSWLALGEAVINTALPIGIGMVFSLQCSTGAITQGFRRVCLACSLIYCASAWCRALVPNLDTRFAVALSVVWDSSATIGVLALFFYLARIVRRLGAANLSRLLVMICVAYEFAFVSARVADSVATTHSGAALAIALRLGFGSVALILLFHAARRLPRLTRGCCLACGYSMAGSSSARCPECGTPSAETQPASNDSRGQEAGS